MNIYDNRLTPAYSKYNVRSYENNNHILNWWLTDYDKLIEKEIGEWEWDWATSITDTLTKIIPTETLEEWKATDPLAKEYAWYNVLMNFAMARASNHGFDKVIRQPQRRTCFLCQQDFVEDSLPSPLIRRLGTDNLIACAPCLRDSLFQHTASETHTKQEVMDYLLSLTEAIEKVPNKGFGEGKYDLIGLERSNLEAALSALSNKPSTHRIETLFGSWLNALIQSGVLEDGTRRTSRGIQTLAKDGHVCLSLGEKTIDDYLYEHGIPHQREPHYPEGRYRADFLVGSVFIEYFGLAGNPEYDAKTKLKKNLCKKHGLTLISIFPKDLASGSSLAKKLAILEQT